MKETVSLVEKKIINHETVHLLGVNADKINELDDDSKMRRITDEAQIVNADGASVVIASHILGKPLPERVAGIDLMQELLKLANEKGYSVYFLGAKKSVVEKMVHVLQLDYRNLNIAGYRDGYFSKKDWKNIGETLMKAKPDIVFVGITSPIKEYLIDFLMKQNVTGVFMGVGGSFDVLSGNIKRAPILIQKLNLEWAYRVMQEPRRLFKRYFFGNAKFTIKIMKEMFNKNGKN